MEPIILLGGGGHCRSVIDVIETLGRYKIFGIIDLPENIGQSCLGHKVIGSENDLAKIRKECPNALVTVGQIKSAELRRKLFQTLKSHNFSLPIIVSPFAHVSAHASLGEGSIVMHGSTVNSYVKIGSNCILNSHSLVEHDTQIADHCHISTGAILNGGVQIGEGSFVGSGALVREQIKIGSNCLIAMGAKIFKDLPANERFL